MYIRIHETPQDRVVAACDEELIGRVLEDGKARLDLERYRSFYAGAKAGADELRNALGAFSSANLVGKGPVDVAVAMGLAGEKDVMYINRIPYIQIYRL